MFFFLSANKLYFHEETISFRAVTTFVHSNKWRLEKQQLETNCYVRLYYISVFFLNYREPFQPSQTRKLFSFFLLFSVKKG